VRRWLERPGPWAATVLVNGRIMTVFLWHATALIAVVGAAHAAGGIGLRLAPDSAAWWATRPLWIAASLVVLALLVALFGRFERPDGGAVRSFPAWRSVAAAAAACAGMTAIAIGGIVGAAGLRGWAIALVLAGALAARSRHAAG
jgi:hypothetical protein